MRYGQADISREVSSHRADPSVTYWHRFEPVLIAHWVASQRCNQYGQRVRPASEMLAGRLGCHIPPFLNGTRHPCLVTCHSHQARNITTRHLWVNYQCAGVYPGLWTNPQCNVPANPCVYELTVKRTKLNGLQDRRTRGDNPITSVESISPPALI